MMSNVRFGYAVITAPVSYNGYNLNLFGARQEWHPVGYRTRGVAAAVPANKHSVKLDSAFPETGNDQDWPTGSQQGCIDHDLYRTSVLRIRLWKNFKSNLRAVRANSSRRLKTPSLRIIDSAERPSRRHASFEQGLGSFTASSTSRR
jgi:hypothetical protein